MEAISLYAPPPAGITGYALVSVLPVKASSQFPAYLMRIALAEVTY